MDVPWHRNWRSRPARSARTESLRGGWILLVIASWVFAALVLFSAAAPAQDVDADTTRRALTRDGPSVPLRESPAAVSEATVGDVHLPGTSDGPPTAETTDGASREDPSNDTTESRETSTGTTDGASDSSGSRDGSGRDDTKGRKKRDHPNNDGGSNGGAGVAVAVGAAAILGAIALSAHEKNKRLQACANEVRALQGHSVGDAVRSLDPARYVVKLVPKASPDDVAANPITGTEVKRLEDDKCVVKLAYAETMAVPSADESIAALPTAAQPVAEPTTPAQPAQQVAQSPPASQPATPARPKPRPPKTVTPPVPEGCRDPIELVSLVGQTRNEVLAWLGPRSLTLDETKVPNSKPEGEVLQQQPSAPAQLRCGETLKLTLSDGSLVIVPAVTSLDIKQAQAAIVGASLVADSADRESDRAPGTVLQQTPVAGSEVPRRSTVSITVASGLVVPDVTRLGLVEAMQRLQAFRVVPSRIKSDFDKDTVASQSPPGGSRAAAGSPVSIGVSLGPWVPQWLRWLAMAALLACVVALLRHFLPKLVHVSARVDLDGSANTEAEVATKGPNLQIDAHLEPGRSRVLFMGDPA